MRRIAILNPVKGINIFTFPIQDGDNDCHTNCTHEGKYGGGGFSGERCLIHRAGPLAGRPVWFRLADHEDRLEETIRAVEWLVVCPRADRIEARFRLAALNLPDCYFSLVFGSEGGVGVYQKDNRAKVTITSYDMDPFAKPYLPVEAVNNGMDVMIVTDPEVHRGPLTKYSRAKMGRNYPFSNIVKHRCQLAGFHDGMMLDENGYVSELTVSNLLLLEEDGLVTPHAASSPLNGITKRTTGTIAQEVYNLPLREEVIPIDRLGRARAIFATGTAVGVVRINRIVADSGQLIYEAKDTAATELVKQLGQFYWRLLYGEESGFHPEWFTPVPEKILAMPEPLVQIP